MKGILYVGAGGVLGALARYYITVPLNEPGRFPVGTLAVNLAGSFLLAFFLTVTLDYITGTPYFAVSPYLMLGLSTGFVGSLTTFSTLSAEYVTMLQTSPASALVYVGSSFALGFLSALSGRVLGKQLPARLKKYQTRLGEDGK